jgi:hypothetical protein
MVVLASSLALGVGGCSFGTTYVTLPAAPSTADPALGEALSVQVKDGRAELSGGQVATKHSWYGAKTGDVALSDNVVLTERVAIDLIGILRERGYRAFDVKRLPIGQADLAVMAEITNFFIAVSYWTGELEGFAVVRVRALNPSGRLLWEDIIRAEYRKTDVRAIVTSDHQAIVEGLYLEMRKKLRDEIPRVFPR